MGGSFNANFYIMSSTVIPVFYIALIVQFPMLNRIMTGIAKMRGAARDSRRDAAPPSGQRLGYGASEIAIGIAITILVLVIIVILLASVEGEIQSILALYYRSNENPSGILRAIIALLIISILVPAWTAVSAFVQFNKISHGQRSTKPPGSV